jgi:hypothetical protein
MGKRFSDINRGGELKLALDNVTQYKTNAATRTTKRITGTGTPTRRSQAFVRIMPFSDSKAANETVFPSYRVKVDVLVTTAGTKTGGKAQFALGKANNYFEKALTGSVKPPTGFSPAKLSTFESTAAGTYAQSKFTKLYYIKTPGTSYHYAIGRPIAGPDTLDEAGAKEALIAALADDLTTGITPPNFRRISFKDEKMGGLG